MQVTTSRSNAHVGRNNPYLVLPHITIGMVAIMKGLSKRGLHQVKHFDKRILTALFHRKVVKRVRGSGDNAVIAFTIRGRRLWLALR